MELHIVRSSNAQYMGAIDNNIWDLGLFLVGAFASAIVAGVLLAMFSMIAIAFSLCFGE